MENGRCATCGLGMPGKVGECAWCGGEAEGPRPVLLPWRESFWRGFTALPGLCAAAPCGTLAQGLLAGAWAGLMLGAAVALIPLPELAAAGAFAADQWWWMLLPDALQMPAVAATRGALLGMVVATCRWCYDWTQARRGEPDGAWQGTVAGGLLVALFALLEGRVGEGLLLAGVGGAFLGAAVDRSAARWAGSVVPGTIRSLLPARFVLDGGYSRLSSIIRRSSANSGTRAASR